MYDASILTFSVMISAMNVSHKYPAGCIFNPKLHVPGALRFVSIEGQSPIHLQHAQQCAARAAIAVAMIGTYVMSLPQISDRDKVTFL